MKVGFIGAGFIARALAGHLIRNGHEVMLSNSREAKSLRSAAVALNCKVGTAEEAARFGDIVALTVPASAYQNIPAEALIGKIVIDIVNHYPDRDGPIPELENNSLATSELIARSLPGATVIKAFNAIMANHLKNHGKPTGTSGRRALPVAGNDRHAKQLVMSLVDECGFDAVDAGTLADSWKFERARPAYCIPLTKTKLEEVLANTGRQDFVTEYSWRE
jgi:predicted dinucleotide-binding enzyme